MQPTLQLTIVKCDEAPNREKHSIPELEYCGFYYVALTQGLDLENASLLRVCLITVTVVDNKFSDALLLSIVYHSPIFDLLTSYFMLSMSSLSPATVVSNTTLAVSNDLFVPLCSRH